MIIERLRQLLVDAGAVLAAGGAKKSAADLDALAELIEDHKGQPFEEVLDQLAKDVAPDTPEERVRQHLSRLQAAGVEESRFRDALKLVEADRAIKKAEAFSVAHGYIGGRTKWPSRAEALKAIEKEFVARRYDASKMKEVARSRPW